MKEAFRLVCRNSGAQPVIVNGKFPKVYSNCLIGFGRNTPLRRNARRRILTAALGYALSKAPPPTAQTFSSKLLCPFVYSVFQNRFSHQTICLYLFETGCGGKNKGSPQSWSLNIRGLFSHFGLFAKTSLS